MGGTRGYRSYRGRTSRGRIALIAVLVLVIAVSVAVIWLQNYVVYDEDGHPHVELPWQEQQSTGQEETPLPLLDHQVRIQKRVAQGLGQEHAHGALARPGHADEYDIVHVLPL